MRVVPVPVRADNYAYLLIDEATNKATAVDPFDVKKVVAAAEAQGVTLGEHLITTHHHQDHSGGNAEFKKLYPHVKIYGGSEQCTGLTDKVQDGDSFSLGEIQVKALATPCHTQDSICFFVQDHARNQRGVFTGDTLFVSGCGRFFEGTPEEMHQALNKTLAGLPDDTLVYCGHEYTAANVSFSASIEPKNPQIQKLKQYVEQNAVSTGKFTIKDEKAHNVFMRLNTPEAISRAGSSDPVEVMAFLREAKNNFKG